VEVEVCRGGGYEWAQEACGRRRRRQGVAAKGGGKGWAQA